MDDQNNIQKAIWCKSNIVLVVIVYLTSAVYPSIGIFEKMNMAAPDLFSKIILFTVVILIAAPACSIGALLCRLWFQQLIKAKYVSDALIPTKGSIANPYLVDLIGHKGKTILTYVFAILIASILLFIIVIGILRKIT